MERTHGYELTLEWTGNRGEGTADARRFGRDHVVTAAGVGSLEGSSDPAFRGDADRWNPEQLLVAALAQCHMLTYLWLAAGAGVVVSAYTDRPTGTMVEAGGAGQFSEVTLHPQVAIATGSDPELARTLHERVGDYCFIARSVNFPVRHDATITPAAGSR